MLPVGESEGVSGEDGSDDVPVVGEGQIDVGATILWLAGERCLPFERCLIGIALLPFFARQMFVIRVQIENRSSPII